jgi:hypothetical protein
MTYVAIVPDRVLAGSISYRAIAGAHQSTGKTAGEALDALTAQLPPDESGTLIIVRSLRPDGLFTAAQQQRLHELMTRWRAARDSGAALPEGEQAELDGLVETELQAASTEAPRRPFWPAAGDAGAVGFPPHGLTRGKATQ